METISIRDLRGAGLADRARQGDLLGLTNYRQLIGVFVPVTPAWVEHLIEYNWSHMRDSVVAGEQEIAGGTPMTTLEGLLADIGGGERPAAGKEDGGQGGGAGKLAAAAVAALALGGNPAQLRPAAETLRKFREVTAPGAGPGGETPPVRTVRIGDVSARLIEEAGAAGQTLALTHDRVLAGIVVPVTRGLVEFLVEQNMSRVLYSIGLGEKEISEGAPLSALGQVVPGSAAGPAGEAAPSCEPRRA